MKPVEWTTKFLRVYWSDSEKWCHFNLHSSYESETEHFFICVRAISYYFLKSPINVFYLLFIEVLVFFPYLYFRSISLLSVVYFAKIFFPCLLFVFGLTVFFLCNIFYFYVSDLQLFILAYVDFASYV